MKTTHYSLSFILLLSIISCQTTGTQKQIGENQFDSSSGGEAGNPTSNKLTNAERVAILSKLGSAKMKMTMPVYSQKLQLQQSKLWIPYSQKGQGGMFIYELVPASSAGKSKAWTELFTITGVEKAARVVNIERSCDNEASGFKKYCPDRFKFKKIKTSQAQGYESAGCVMGCEEPKGSSEKSEFSFYKFIKGRNDYYIIKISYRSDDAPRVFSAQNFDKFAPELNEVTLCQDDGPGPECNPEGPK